MCHGLQEWEGKAKAEKEALAAGADNVDAAGFKRKSPEKDIEEALRKANATFVNYMEKGLDTYIGSSSVSNLSGG